MTRINSSRGYWSQHVLVRALTVVLAITAPVSAMADPPARQLRSQALSTTTSTPLTRLDSGLFLTTVTLNGKKLKMAVSTRTAEIWVKCDVWGGTACAAETIAETTDDSYLRSMDLTEYSLDSFDSATIGGLDFVDGFMNVAFGEVAGLGDGAQGILGLAYGTSALFSDGLLDRISLQIDAADGASTMTFNGVDASLTKKSAYATEIKFLTGADGAWGLSMTRFSLSMADGSEEVSQAVSGTAYLDPNVPWLGIDTATMETFGRRVATACTLVDDAYYTCDASVTLPRLTLTLGSWEFYLEPEDYTETVVDSSPQQVKVLLSNAASEQGQWVLGAPFMRKFYTSFSTGTRNTITLYCDEEKTCATAKEPFDGDVEKEGNKGDVGSSGKYDKYFDPKNEYGDYGSDYGAIDSIESGSDGPPMGTILTIFMICALVVAAAILTRRWCWPMMPCRNRRPIPEVTFVSPAQSPPVRHERW